MPDRSQRAPSDGSGRYGPGGPTGGGAPVRYGAADAELLRECIDTVSQRGDALLLGRTQDGSAFHMRVLSDAGGAAYYPPTTEALTGVMTYLIDAARSSR